MNGDDQQLEVLQEPHNFDRRDRRYISSVPITVQRFLRFGPVIAPGLTLDISMRGMSGLICGAPQAGETVVIKLFVSGARMEILATVLYSSDARSGFRFYPFSRVAEQVIQDWLLELEKQEHGLSRYPFQWARRTIEIDQSMSRSRSASKSRTANAATLLIGQQGQSLDSPGDMVDGAVSGEDGGFSGSEGKSD